MDPLLCYLQMSEQPKHPESKLPIFGTFLTLIAFGVSFSVIPPLITTIADELKVNYASFGYILVFQAVSFFIAAIIGGWICERHSINSRALVVIGLLIVGLTLLLGSALTRMTWFIIWAIPLGFGGGLIETFASILVAQNDKPHSSKLMNLGQLFFCIGAISSSPVVAAMLYLGISWQYIFILFGLFILFILCVFFFLTRKGSKDAVHSVQKANKFSTPLLKDSLFFLLAAVLLIYVTFESVIACWVSVYFEKRLSVPVHSAALRLSIYWIGLVVGRLAIIVVPHRFTLWPAMFTGILIVCIGAVLASLTLSPLWATVFVFLSGFGAGPLWPTTVAICHSARQRPKFTSYVIAAGGFGVVLGSGLGSVIFRYLDSSLFFPSVALGSIILLILTFLSYQKYSKTHIIEE